jgi:hypothetical protein
MEIWKKIKKFNNEYEVSNLGNIRSVHGIVTRSNGWKYTRESKQLKPSLNRSGYLAGAVCIDKKITPYIIHRLVAEEFIPNPLNKLEVNHINGNKLDNRVENLEWMTRQENMTHAYENGLVRILKGSEIGTSILNEEQVKEIRSKFIPRVYSRVKLAKEYNISEATIKDILYKRTWTHLL